MTHISRFVGRSEHFLPFFIIFSVGLGFVHVLKRERAPAPHVTEH